MLQAIDIFTTIPAGFAAAPDRFHNLPDALLADQIGDLDCQSKAIETELKAAKDALKARGVEKAFGERFTVCVSETVRWNLDTAAVKAEMGAKWYDAHCKTAPVTTVRVTVNKAALAFAA